MSRVVGWKKALSPSLEEDPQIEGRGCPDQSEDLMYESLVIEEFAYLKCRSKAATPFIDVNRLTLDAS